MNAKKSREGSAASDHHNDHIPGCLSSREAEAAAGRLPGVATKDLASGIGLDQYLSGQVISSPRVTRAEPNRGKPTELMFLLSDRGPSG